jgi:molybdopterin molybdotransferase
MLTNLDPEEALALVLAAARPREPVPATLAASLGLSLAADALAERDHPSFDRAMMDGLAVRTAAAGAWVEVVGELPAGRAPDRAVGPGQAVEIMTGAVMPPGADAVAPVETITRDGARALLPPGLRPGDHVAPRGSECRQGQTVLPAGTVVTPLAMANLATLGLCLVPVVPRPRVAIVTTGDEVRPHDEPADGPFIRNSNGPMLEALCRGLCIDDVERSHCRDDAAALRAAVERALERDVVMLSGGVSAGKYDLVPAALQAAGVQLVFHKVRQKPGKPLLFGSKGDRLVFGLPGTPLGSHFCFHRYVRPALRRMAGLPPDAIRLRGQLLRPLATDGDRAKFVLARGDQTASGVRLLPLEGKGSSDVFAPASANAYILLPAGRVALEAGSTVDFEWIGAAR